MRAMRAGAVVIAAVLLILAILMWNNASRRLFVSKRHSQIASLTTTTITAISPTCKKRSHQTS